MIINQSLKDLVTEDLSSQNAILLAALNKREQLKESFKEENSKVNPLVLIQLPNADDGDKKLEQVKQFLKDNDITEENGKLAIWLSDIRSSSLDDLTKNDNEIEYLIFKQAIDTGWDCPRAQILVKLREIRSTTFEIQTVGRILRMPEQKHYLKNENLNKAYIYTNIESITVKAEEYNPNIIKRWSSRLKENVDAELKISSYYKSRVDYGNIMSDFQQVFVDECLDTFSIDRNSINFIENIEKLKSYDMDLSLELDPQKLYSDYILDSTKIDGGYEVEDNSLQVGFKNDDTELQGYFEEIIKENTGSFAPKRSLSPIKTSIYRFFNEYLGSGQWENEMKSIQVVIIKNRSIFIPILLNAIDNYKLNNRNKFEDANSEKLDYNYHIPHTMYFNEHKVEELESHEKYTHSPCYLDINRSTPEKTFETYIDNNKSVVWWFKNGENKQEFLGIKYEYEGIVRTFYPDYIIKTEKSIGLLEVKEKDDRDGQTWTKAKSNYLQKYIVNMNNHKEGTNKIFGGIVIENNEEWLINMSEDLEWVLVMKNDYSQWQKLSDILKKH
ncbi:hypothetical protein [Salinicoccus sp. HZC-1]|uniref:hypothetical protein n=1 Tax=Salinicoccus sp. HZC-1 TaxID=3385497 RepID=UPI00398A67FD